ncbi:MAG: TetR/AcrR family transcriptional regulator [Clostridia bacterium]|nr:TetR/AcrR family transcriptional regulator [Clostridia bacterium]
MPKIIENLPERLIEEARRQAWEGGYTAVTIRSVAAACGVGVGTVYNYFPSKDALLAAFLLADWKDCLQAMENAKTACPQCVEVLRAMCREVRRYLVRHRAIFRDPAAAQAVSPVISRYHGLLRDQLAVPLMSFCADEDHARFLAEALLTWTVEGWEEDRMLPLLEKLL